MDSRLKGLTLCEKFYEEYGAPMIKEKFPELENILAVGLIGSGSECFGYDDEVSEDHDFEPGFCIFAPEGAVDSRTAFRLEREYAKLPSEFMGHKRQNISPVGGNRHGLIDTGDFLMARCGSRDGSMSPDRWFTVPEHYLAEIVNGKIFRDDSGFLTKIREDMVMPEDVRLKKLAGHILLMNQSGQYNFMRCIAHNEPAAAGLAAFEFVTHTLAAVFLLNRRFLPYYKWQFRALSELPILGNLGDPLYYLISTENRGSNPDLKYGIIEDIASLVIGVLQDEGLTDAICGDLEKHAYSVNDRVRDPEIRNLNVLAGV